MPNCFCTVYLQLHKCQYQHTNLHVSNFRSFKLNLKIFSTIIDGASKLFRGILLDSMSILSDVITQILLVAMGI